MRWLALILVVGLLGCHNIKPGPALSAAGVGVARAQAEIANAEWNVEKASELANRKEQMSFLEGASHNHKNAYKELVAVDKALATAVEHLAWLEAAYEKCKWLGWQTRHLIWWAIGLFIAYWTLTSASVIFLGVTGHLGASKWIVRNLLLGGSPAAVIRDRLRNRE